MGKSRSRNSNSSSSSTSNRAHLIRVFRDHLAHVVVSFRTLEPEEAIAPRPRALERLAEFVVAHPPAPVCVSKRKQELYIFRRQLNVGLFEDADELLYVDGARLVLVELAKCATNVHVPHLDPVADF